MRGLLQKDLFLTVGRSKSLLVILVVGLIMSFSTDGDFMVSYLTVLASIMSISTVSYDEYDNGYPFLFSLPITRREYVKSKYLFSLAMGFFGLVVGLILLFVTNWLFKESSAVFVLEDILGAIMVCLVVTSFMLPLQFKFGAERSRVVVMVVAGVFMAVGYVLPRVMNFDVDLNSTQIILITFSLSVIFTIVSYFVSLGVINKKEF